MLTVLYTFEACSKTITAYSSLNYIPVFVEYVQKIERIKTVSYTHLDVYKRQPIILIVVGYSMELVPELIGPCIKTIVLRIILQAAMIMGVLIAVKYLVGSSRLLNLAIIIYMSSPATFSMQTFLKKKESSAYASTTNSLYCIVSILVYIVLAVLG